MVASGASPASVLPSPDTGGAELYRASALDVIYAFFMNCYHLRDWLIKSGRDKGAVDAYIDCKDSLVWSRDICNGMKHYRLDPTMKTTRYESWTTATESAVYMDGKPLSRAQPLPGKHWVFLDPVSGEKRDMFDLARACVDDWAAFV